MNGKLVPGFLLLCIAHSQTQSSNDCPADPSIEKLLPHEDCHKFYQCSYGIPVEFECPENLLFNTQKEQCDWPKQVDCGNRTIGPKLKDLLDNSVVAEAVKVIDSESALNLEPSDKCPTDWTIEMLLPAEECNKFYKCWRGVPYPIDCPPGLLYNPSKWQCDWPENVDCSDRTASEVIHPEQIPKQFVPNDKCPLDSNTEKLLPHEECKKFYKCFNGQAIPLDCPSELVYNIDKSQCDWPDNVNCGERL